MKWYGDWQNREHVRHFDSRSALDDRNLALNYDSLNDVCLLNERVDRQKELNLLEVGCATGELYRYLQNKFPKVIYYGFDISRPAIDRAKEKYPEGKLFVNSSDVKISDTLKELRLPENPEVVYAKDVVHHQIRPFEFLVDLLKIPSEMLIIRCRTRDIGRTEVDPERSCQYHYRGWMPYIVINLEELIDHITREVPGCEVVVYRNRMVLGGQYNRFLPKDCYLPETGTAETAVGVFKNTRYPEKVTIEDRVDRNPKYTLCYRLKSYARRALSALAKW